MAEVELEIKHKKSMAKRVDVFHVFTTIILALSAIVILYPILNMLAYSFSDFGDMDVGSAWSWPQKWTLKGYEELLFNRDSFRQAIFTTVARTVVGTVTSLFATALLAFILSRKRFMFKKGLSLFWVLTMYVNAGIVPTMVLYKYLHLTASFWVYIIPGMANALYVIVIRTYIKGIPDSIEEAAQLEGAGYIKIFWSIICPLCKPVYAAIALFTAVSQWNSWFDTMLYNKFDEQYTTIQYEIMKLITPVTERAAIYGARHPKLQFLLQMKFAGIIISIIPLVVVYPFLQKYFVTGLTVGGVKD